MLKIRHICQILGWNRVVFCDPQVNRWVSRVAFLYLITSLYQTRDKSYPEELQTSKGQVPNAARFVGFALIQGKKTKILGFPFILLFIIKAFFWEAEKGLNENKKQSTRR